MHEGHPLPGGGQLLRTHPELDGVARERELVVVVGVARARGGVAVEVEGLALARRIEVERIGDAVVVVLRQLDAVGDVVVVGVEALADLEVEEVGRAVAIGVQEVLVPPPVGHPKFAVDLVVEVHVGLGVGRVGEPVGRGVGVVQDVVEKVVVALLLVAEAVLVRVGEAVAGEPRAGLVVKVGGLHLVADNHVEERAGLAGDGVAAGQHADVARVGVHVPVADGAEAVRMLVAAILFGIGAGLSDDGRAAIERVEAVVDLPVVVHAVMVGVGIAGHAARERISGRRERPDDRNRVIDDLNVAGLPRGRVDTVGEHVVAQVEFGGRIAVVESEVFVEADERGGLELSGDRILLEHEAAEPVVCERVDALHVVGDDGDLELRVRLGLLQVVQRRGERLVPSARGQGDLDDVGIAVGQILGIPEHMERVGDLVGPAALETDDRGEDVVDALGARASPEEVGGAIGLEVDGLAVGIGVRRHRDRRGNRIADIVEAHHRRAFPFDRVDAVVGGDVGVGRDLGGEVVVLHRIRGLVFAEGNPELLVVGAVPVVVAPSVDGGRKILLVVREAVAIGIAVGAELALEAGAKGVGGVVEARGVVPGVAEAVEACVGRAGVEVEEREAVAVVVSAGLLVLARVGDAVAVGIAVPWVGRIELVGPVRRLGPIPVFVMEMAGHLLGLDINGIERMDLVGARVEHRPVLELGAPSESVALLVVRIGAEGSGAIRRQGVERGPDIVDQIDAARWPVAGVERPAVGDVVRVGVVAAGVQGLDRLHPVVVPPHRWIDGVHEHRVVAAVVLADHPLLDVELLACGEGDVEVAGGGGMGAGSGNEAERRLAVPIRVVEVVIEEGVAVAVAPGRIHVVAVGVLGSVAGIVGIKLEEDLPAVGQTVVVGVPVDRIGAEEVFLVVGEAVAVEVGHAIPLPGIDSEGFEDRDEVGISLPLVVPEADERIHRIELREQPALGEEAVHRAVGRGERGVAGADDIPDVRREVVVAGKEELAGEEVDVGARDLAGLQLADHRRGIGALLAVVAGVGPVHILVVGLLARLVEELGAAERVDVAVARVDFEAAHVEDDGGGWLLGGGVFVVGNGGDWRVGEGVLVARARGGIEVGASVVALVADQFGLELLVGIADEEPAVVFGLEVRERATEERQACRLEIGSAAGGEIRVEGEGRVERAPVLGAVLVENRAPEVVFPAIFENVTVGVGDRGIGDGAVAAARVVDEERAEDAGIAVMAPVRMILVGRGGLGKAAELEDVGEVGLCDRRLAGKVLVCRDAGNRDEGTGARFEDAGSVVDVVAGERILEHADEIDHAVRVVVVGVVGPDVRDLLIETRGNPIVVGRVVEVAPGSFAVAAVPHGSGGAVFAARLGDGERAPFGEGVSLCVLSAVEIVGLPLVGQAVLVEIAEIVERIEGVRGEVANGGRPAGLGGLDQDGGGAGIRDIEVGGRGGEGGLVVGELPAEGIGPGGEKGLDHRVSGRIEVVSVQLVPWPGRVVKSGRSGIDGEVRGAVSAANGDRRDGADVGEEHLGRIGERDHEVAGLGPAAVVVGRVDANLLSLGVDRDGRLGSLIGRSGPVVDQVRVVVRRDVGGAGGKRERRPLEGRDRGCRLRIVVRRVKDRIDVVDRSLEDGGAEESVRVGRGDREVVVAVDGIDAERARRGIAGNRDRGRNGHVVGGCAGAIERQLKDDVRGGGGAERDIDAVRGDSLVDVHHVGGEGNPILHAVAGDMDAEGDCGARIGVVLDRHGNRRIAATEGNEGKGCDVCRAIGIGLRFLVEGYRGRFELDDVRIVGNGLDLNGSARVVANDIE